MAAYKSAFAGALLAIFLGPLSYLYVGKWKKTLLLIPLMFIPIFNILVYLYIFASMILEVRRYNQKAFRRINYGVIPCTCGSESKAGSKYCRDCGKLMLKDCPSCKASVPANDYYCTICGKPFKDKVQRKKIIQKIAIGSVIVVISIFAAFLSLSLAQEQQTREAFINNVKLANFTIPEHSNSKSFTVRYELSQQKPAGLKGLHSHINGTGIVAPDYAASFDGKKINWKIKSLDSGNKTYNITLYYNDMLLDSRQFTTIID